jgi:hypothetical protein
MLTLVVTTTVVTIAIMVSIAEVFAVGTMVIAAVITNVVVIAVAKDHVEMVIGTLGLVVVVITTTIPTLMIRLVSIATVLIKVAHPW